MSTKRQLREQREQEEAAGKADQRFTGLKWAYLAVCCLLLYGVYISLRESSFLMRNSRASKNVMTSLESYTPWPQEVRDQFQKILVQNGGRVKPLNTYARYSLMQINNLKSVKFETTDGKKHKIKADEWLLDALFRGEIAKELPIFNVDDTDVVQGLGIEPKQGDSEHRKRDRYSYNHLVTQRAKMAEEAGKISDKKDKYDKSDKDPNLELNRNEGLLLRLSQNISLFEFLVGQFASVRNGDYQVNDTMLPDHLKDISKRMDMSKFLDMMPAMNSQQLFSIMSQEATTDEELLFKSPFQLFFFYANSGRNLILFPPADRMNDEWRSIGDSLLVGMTDKEKRVQTKEDLRSIKGLYDGQKTMFLGIEKLKAEAGKADIDESAYNAVISPLVKKMSSFVSRQKDEVDARYQARLDTINSQISSAEDQPLEKDRLGDKLRETRKEAAESELENHLHNTGYFHSAMSWFIMSFLIVCIGLVSTGSKVSKWILIAAAAVIVLGLGYNVVGIVIRCIVRNRPPITNLYDTVIFITATMVFLSLFIELFSRKGIGLLLASLCGAIGMLLATRFEVKGATDTMDPLQAVLDTNFWLATHVVTINIGYAAGLLAMFMGGYYLLHRFLRPLPRVIMSFSGNKKDELSQNDFFAEDKPIRDFFKSISRKIYAITCFCLLFSIVGTVLGGVWANYSWGRFWGWDPKENGALMICLWSLVILHGRMGGYIRDIGMAVNAIILGIIVTFSWWGVNNLGIGLHSYGFTEGVWPSLFKSWTISAMIMMCGVPLWLNEQNKRRIKKSAAARRKQSAPDADAATA